jgi:hypothetical protein
MGNKALIYKQKLVDSLNESFRHMDRLDNAITALNRIFPFPLSLNDFSKILENIEHIAYADQIFYRFSKLQDCMGAKLFKSVLLFEGQTANQPFLDILNQLERLEIVNVDDWFELRDLRNEIAHEYGENEESSIHILNLIFQSRVGLRKILNSISKLIT